ncbi:MAG: STAS/SEC14 domain-containing protein [Schleiferiaceae bacterium]|nr:STAS/SEC14 domain-containing protein [Schleiferiaceae bacterium]
MEKKYAEISFDEHPVVKITFTGQAANDENFAQYLDDVERAYARNLPIALIFDATRATIPGFKYQQWQAQWLKDYEEMMKKHCTGTAYIIPNLVIRNLLKAIFALQAQPVPYKIFPSLDEGRRWALSQLDQKGTAS